ncbi:ABC transporter permease subunit [Paenibacillus sp. 102]|uniref:ABC transporter permease subunit n=1 Tax=Paenibacillus sp. 102 TaxID=3120823 RepID=UPI0031BB9BD3
MKSIWTSKRFLFGFIYLFSILTASFIYGWYFKSDTLKPLLLLYNENKDLIGAAPFSPVQMPPLGSDRFGESIFYQLLDGAKFTILFALIIALLRTVFSAILGIIISLYVKPCKKIIKAFSEVFYYVPTVFIAAILILPVNVNIDSSVNRLEPNVSFAIYQAIILILVALPTVSLFISSEIDEFMKTDYILSSKLMGASRFHILKKHLRVLLRERLFILFMEHVVQTLILMIHLSLIQIVIGGAQVKDMGDGRIKLVSMSNDWAGLIGLNYYEINIAIWIILGTLIAFFITILVIKFMISGIQDALNVQKSVIKVENRDFKEESYKQNKESFTFASKEQSSYHSSINM